MKSFDLDWSEAGLSRHEQVRVMAQLAPLLEILPPLDQTSLRPIVAVGGGQTAWKLHTRADLPPGRRVVRRCAEAASRPAIDYSEHQRLEISCHKNNRRITSRFAVAGYLAPLDHAIILTALGGNPQGCDLAALKASGKIPGRYHLGEITVLTPEFQDLESGEPMLPDTLAPFIARARELITTKAPARIPG